MAVSVAGVLRAINNLSGPLKEKALKKFGLSMQGKPGRTSKKDGINVGKDRVKIKEKIDKNLGRFQATATIAAAYTAGDFINDLLGIKSMGRGTLKADGASGEYTKMPLKTKKPTPKKKAVKKTPPKAPPPKPDSVKKKKKQLMMKEKYTGKDSNVKFNSRGGMLKKGKK
jgi:hypothetical protein